MNHFRPIVFAAALMALCGVATAKPVTYTIGTKISRVTFTVEHQGFIQLFGTLKFAPGSFTFDEQDWPKSSIAVTMPTKMLDMGDVTWNQQIRGDDNWANLFKYPSITFRSTGLKKEDDAHGTLYGDLTLAGVTRRVEFPLRLNKLGVNAVNSKPSVGFSATTTIKRSAFGLNAYEDLVGDDIHVQIQVEAFVGADDDAH